MHASRSDVRAISESTGVAVLLVITVVASASVGLSALLVAEDDTEYGAEIQFSYLEARSELLVFYTGGEDLRAGNLHFRGPDAEVTWAQLRGVGDDARVTPSQSGTDPVRLGSNTAYGSEVAEEGYVEVVYEPTEEDDLEEPVVLATWGEPPEGGGDGLGGDDLGGASESLVAYPLMLQTG